MDQIDRSKNHHCRKIAGVLAGVLMFGVAPTVRAADEVPATQPAAVVVAPALPVLKYDDYKHYVDRFNTMEDEFQVNMIPNAEAWAWMVQNVPAFDCPDKDVEEISWYRWYAYRKAFKQMPDYIAMTEFIKRNPVSSGVGHHIMEGRWLRNTMYTDQTIMYWLGGPNGGNHDNYNYSSWDIYAAYQRYLVNKDKAFVVGMLDNFIRSYKRWEQTRMNPDGSFWQFDVRDAMEESISGSRTERNIRPPLNSYMYGNALALAEIGKLANRPDVVETYTKKAEGLKKLVQDRLWDKDAKFFKVQFTDGTLCDARESIGFIPFYFELPDKDKNYQDAYAQAIDPKGFLAPYGLTTAEQRSPKFRVGKTGGCEWNGPVWPFATSQALTGLANVMNDYPSSGGVTKKDFVEAIRTYVKSMHDPEGRPYIGEYLDEQTGKYLRRSDFTRGRYYNHSTFNDLIINDLVGIRPRADDTLEINPLVPTDAWDYFCLDGVMYHGKMLTILWDRTGERYHRGKGLVVLADGKQIATAPEITKITATLN